MRKAFAVGCFMALWVAVEAFGSDLRIAIVQGSLVQTFTGTPGGRYSIQCPNIDGGSGVRVAYRPGCPNKADAGVSCIHDAGMGDTIMDFTSSTGSQDPYKIDLQANEDRIYFVQPDLVTNSYWCTISRRSP